MAVRRPGPTEVGTIMCHFQEDSSLSRMTRNIGYAATKARQHDRNAATTGLLRCHPAGEARGKHTLLCSTAKERATEELTMLGARGSRRLHKAPGISGLLQPTGELSFRHSALPSIW